jgi:hypothetical protein
MGEYAGATGSCCGGMNDTFDGGGAENVKGCAGGGGEDDGSLEDGGFGGLMVNEGIGASVRG